MAEMTLLEFVQHERDRGAFDHANETAAKLGLPDNNLLNSENALWYLLSTAVSIQDNETKPGELPIADAFWEIVDVDGELTLVLKKIPEERFVDILNYGNRQIIQKMLGRLIP